VPRKNEEIWQIAKPEKKTVLRKKGEIPVRNTCEKSKFQTLKRRRLKGTYRVSSKKTLVEQSATSRR
jgi:hypothetical protein